MDAISELSGGTRIRPRVTVTEGTKAERSVRETLSALQGLFTSLGCFAEQVLLSLHPHIDRDAMNAFVPETCCETDRLAACRDGGGVNGEDLNIAELDDKSLSLEVQGYLDAVAR